MDAKAVDTAYIGGGKTSGRRTRSAATVTRTRVKVVTAKASGNLEDEPRTDVVVVSADEYERLVQCTTNPEPPTDVILKGAEILRSLRAPSR